MVSDLILHCLPMSHKKGARLLSVNRGPYMSAQVSLNLLNEFRKLDNISLLFLNSFNKFNDTGL